MKYFIKKVGEKFALVPLDPSGTTYFAPYISELPKVQVISTRSALDRLTREEFRVLLRHVSGSHSFFWQGKLKVNDRARQYAEMIQEAYWLRFDPSNDPPARTTGSDPARGIIARI